MLLFRDGCWRARGWRSFFYGKPKSNLVQIQEASNGFTGFLSAAPTAAFTLIPPGADASVKGALTLAVQRSKLYFFPSLSASTCMTDIR